MIGHWNTLTEAERLTQSQLIPGVIEEQVYREPILGRIPVAQAKGKSIKYNREKTDLSSSIQNADVGDTLTWTSNVEYDPQEVSLKRCYIQRILDDFIAEVYNTEIDYRAQKLFEMKKGLVVKLNDKIFYDDLTYGSKEFDGLHAWAAVQTGTSLDIDGGEVGFSLHNLRVQIDAMKHGVDFIYIPIELGRRFDELYQEKGLAYTADYSGSTTMYNLMSMLSFGINEAGQRVSYWDGKLMLRTDYLVAEQANTGVGSNKRAKYSSSTKNYSAFCVKFGDVFAGNPGLCLGFGNTKNLGDFYKIVVFEALENQDASGIRLVNYSAPLLGSKLCLGRIYDYTDAAITA